MNNLTTMRSYASAVSGVDDGVGTILTTLDELGIAENTLVIYTADHGLCAGHNGMWGMGDHSRPRHMFQQNLRIPLIFRHPEVITGGGVVEEMRCNYDFFPSMLDYLGLAQQGELVGTSYAPALRGENLVRNDEITFHEYEETRTVQTRAWKLIRRHPDGPDELYDMAHDPGERVNLIDRPDCAEVQADLDARLTDFFATYADAEYDPWAGGRTKAGKLVG